MTRYKLEYYYYYLTIVSVNLPTFIYSTDMTEPHNLMGHMTMTRNLSGWLAICRLKITMINQRSKLAVSNSTIMMIIKAIQNIKNGG